MTERPFPPARVHFSALRSMGRSPAHFRAAEVAGFEPTPAMKFGLAVHSLTLGGQRVVRFEADARRGKAWTEFEEQHADKIILTAPEHDRALAVAEKVRTHPIARGALAGEHEVSLEWDYCGRACAGRIDVVGEDFLTELKTTTNASPAWFRFHALRMAYNAQVAWYREGMRANRRPVGGGGYIVAVEVRDPFAVTVFRMTEAALEQGEKTVRLWFERFLACEQSGEWPEYAQDIVDLDVLERDLELEFEGDEAA